MSVRAFRSVASLIIAFVASTAGAQPTPGQVLVTPITSGFSAPIGVFNAGDGSPRLFVVQRGGQVRVVREGVLQATPFLTLNASTQCRPAPGAALVTVGFTSGQPEQGLLGLAFHPDYESNGRVFASFSDINGDSMIARFERAEPGTDALSAADLASCVIVLRVDQDFANHNGGNILFGPDEFLYFGLGDGGSGNDPCNRGQTLRPADLPASDGVNGCAADSAFVNSGGNPDSRALQGKLLRIDVDASTSAGANGLCAAQTGATAGAANYAIPTDNPYAQPGDALGRCDEVWAYGLRNPWRFSFDRLTGDLFVGDVGQDHWEEVSFVAAGSPFGHNFDWKICEGTHVRATCNACGTDDSEVVIEYENSGNPCASTPVSGCSVTGGFRYRGPDPILQGVYFYGDACNAQLYFSTESGGSWTQPGAGNTVGGLAGSILSFGEDEGGALHAVAGGTLYRIGIADALFDDGFE